MMFTEPMAKRRSKPHSLSQKDYWETPDKIFSELNAEFNFTLDPCCELHTAKCKKFYTPKENGLLQSWVNERVFVNPPYSKGNIDLWMEKCMQQRHLAICVVALIPVSTSSAWFHDFVLPCAKIRFIRGRLRFRGAPYDAPFSSMIAIY